MIKRIKLAILLVGVFLASNLSAKQFTLLAYAEKGSPAHKLILEKIKKFESKHKGYTIKVDIASSKAYHTKLQILSVANKLPDIMHIFVGNRTAYVTKRGLIADLRPLFDNETKNSFIAQALVAQGSKGEIYQIPENLTLTGIVYSNKKLMDKLNLTFPKTYQEWLKQVKVIQKAGLTPLALGNKAPWVVQSILLSTVLGRTAGDEWLQKAVNGKVSFTDKPFLSSLETLKEMYDTGLLDKATPTWDYNQGTNEFLRSKAVYSMNGGWIVNNYNKNAKAEFLDGVNLHAFPAMKNEVNSNSVSGILGIGFGLNAKLSTADKKILFDLVKINAGLGVEQEAIAIGNIPLMQNLKFSKNIMTLVKKLKNLTENSKITYVFDGIMDPQSVGKLQNLIQEMFLGSKSASEVAKDFEAYASKNSPMRKN